MVKASLRLGVNVSPEPFSNILTSLVEELLVAGVVVLAIFHPVAAAVVAGVLLALGLLLVVLTFSRIRRFWLRRRERREARVGARGGVGVGA